MKQTTFRGKSFNDDDVLHAKVRGIIVASDFTVRMIYAAKVVPGLSLKKYQVLFKFTDV